MAINVKYPTKDLFGKLEVKLINVSESEISMLKKEFAELKNEEAIVLHLEQLFEKAVLLEHDVYNNLMGTSNPNQKGLDAFKKLRELFPQIKRLFNILETEHKKNNEFTHKILEFAEWIEHRINQGSEILRLHGYKDVSLH